MRNLVLAALAVMLFVCPAHAATGALQTQSFAVPRISGTLTTVTTDTIVLEATGNQWATVRFKVTTAGTATATAQTTSDGTNWVAAPYARRLSTANANPTVQAISATTLTTGDEWEVPLPGNATHFRLQCGGTGTVTTVRLYGGLAYVPGVPVTATLFDAAVTAGANNNTGTLDGSGWSALSWLDVVTSATTSTQVINQVDDAGTATAVASIASLVVGTYVGGIGVGVSLGTAITPVTGLTQFPMPKRFNFALSGATTSAIRLRLEVRR